jgi:hypothetical protein
MVQMVHPPQRCVHPGYLHLVPVRPRNRQIFEDAFMELTPDRFIAVFLCHPVSDYWLVGSPDGSCMDEGVVTLICGVINCVADFATTVTPIPLILGVSILVGQF